MFFNPPFGLKVHLSIFKTHAIYIFKYMLDIKKQMGLIFISYKDVLIDTL